jgi:hypothetical protein
VTERVREGAHIMLHTREKQTRSWASMSEHQHAVHECSHFVLRVTRPGLNRKCRGSLSIVSYTYIYIYICMIVCMYIYIYICMYLYEAWSLYSILNSSLSVSLSLIEHK